MLPIKDILQNIKDYLGARDVNIYLGHSGASCGAATTSTNDDNRQYGLPVAPAWPNGTGGEGESVGDNVLNFEGRERHSVPRHKLPHSQPLAPDVTHTSHLNPIFEAQREAEPSVTRSFSEGLLSGFSKKALMNGKTIAICSEWRQSFSISASRATSHTRRATSTVRLGVHFGVDYDVRYWRAGILVASSQQHFTPAT